MDKRQWGEADYNAVLKEVEGWLKRILASTGFDVETVELKGRCPVVVWGKDWDRQVKHFVMGGLAKMPRDWTRFDEWKATTRITAHELRKLPELYPVEVTVEVKKSVEKQEAAGSVRGKHIDKERFRLYLPLAQRFLPSSEPVSAKSRVCVTAEDVAIFLVLLEFFAENPNPDGSMPLKRFAALWQRLYLDGDVTRAFDNKRFAFVRNLVSDKGGIEWEDVTYGEGKAARWKASGGLLALMRECRVSLSTDNNYQRKLGGNRGSDPDPIWLEMTSGNGRNVGLRPVRVVVRAEKRALEDRFGELEAMGLAWMAA